ncbi:THO complex subunit 4A [Physcomitrium patens]|uniref:RRM domain-containing protein n=2 Tax=Physcomitrium patens TaxID=3218 RepID=A0A2K1KE31_PHYPA|nr:THO complex subunit 4A-like [Physcomitrium patens]PNR52037.1 hypothetical protein PHYPA_008411 [Physcomitrium patens]|eukprot:XP_024377464.1 THO complex subunit 4A-like [Physcomitrella patens]
MTSALDMSLDDLIKTNKSSTRGRRGGGRGAGSASRRGGATAAAGAAVGYPGGKTSGPARRQVGRAVARPTPYASAKLMRRVPDYAFQYADNFLPAGGRGMGKGIETGTKLYISNLDYGVSNDDIKELFSEVGDLKRCSINYDRSGRSKGTAEVVFIRKPDALSAMKRYNNVQLDGKPMKIEIIGTNLRPARFNGGLTVFAGRGRAVASPFVPFVRGPGSFRGRGAFRGRGVGRGAGRGVGRSGGRGGGRSGAPAVEKSVEDLDKELEAYHTEAMQTN